MNTWNGIGQPTTNLDKTVRVKLRSGRPYTTRVGDLVWAWDPAKPNYAGDIVEYELVDDEPVRGNGEVAGSAGRVSNPKDAAGDARIPLWLLSGVAKVKWALAQFAGLLKYGAWNWRIAGVRYSTYLSAMERHIEGIKAGEVNDPVDGTDHLGNIMACAAIIIDARAAGKLTDDRPPSVDHRQAVAEGEALMVALREKYKDKKPYHYSIADSR